MLLSLVHTIIVKLLTYFTIESITKVFLCNVAEPSNYRKITYRMLTIIYYFVIAKLALPEDAIVTK